VTRLGKWPVAEKWRHRFPADAPRDRRWDRKIPPIARRTTLI
jgi:hypothetical protein